MDQSQINGDAYVQPQLTSMESRQKDFNAQVNLLMPSKMGYLHYVQDGGPHNVPGPWLGDDL
jgi:hypothetical protein